MDLGILAEVDLTDYASSQEDLDELVDLWEELAFDPWFSKLVTQDTIKTLELANDGTWRRWKRDWSGSEAKGWQRKGRRVVELPVGDFVVARFNGGVPDRAGLAFLQEATQSFAPIVNVDYFVGRTLSTFKSKEKLFETVWGGLYYDFAGIRKSQVKGRSDLEQLLVDIGVEVPLERFLDRVRSDERAVLFRSLVTAKPRRILWIGTSNSRLSIASGVFFLTEDVRDQDVDARSDPVKSLLNFKPQAFEAIWTRRNGQLGYALFGADGQLLDEADVHVAGDHRVPAPNTPVLQSAKSCIGCHGPFDGWQPFTNDLADMAKIADVYGDLSNKDFSTINRLRGQYKGSPRKPLFRAREDNALAAFYATGPWPGGELKDTAISASAAVERLWFQDRYDPVDAAQAMRDLGLRTAGGDGARAELEAAVPARRLYEDPVLVGIKAGKRVTRVQWMLSYSYVLERVRR